MRACNITNTSYDIISSKTTANVRYEKIDFHRIIRIHLHTINTFSRKRLEPAQRVLHNTEIRRTTQVNGIILCILCILCILYYTLTGLSACNKALSKECVLYNGSRRRPLVDH